MMIPWAETDSRAAQEVIIGDPGSAVGRISKIPARMRQSRGRGARRSGPGRTRCVTGPGPASPAGFGGPGPARMRRTRSNTAVRRRPRMLRPSRPGGRGPRWLRPSPDR